MGETPPRMRGRQNIPISNLPSTGNTPAHAGKTQELQNIRTKGGKHPRACGEDGAVLEKAKDDWETPPRMRGRQNGKETNRPREGNTPAHAGKTLTYSIPFIISTLGVVDVDFLFLRYLFKNQLEAIDQGDLF